MSEHIENNQTPVEVPPANLVPPADPAPPAPAPPAAKLALQGEITDERVLEIARRESALEERERKAREIEMTVAERERKAQAREEALRQPTAPPVKTKRKRNFTDPIFCEEEVDD